MEKWITKLILCAINELEKAGEDISCGRIWNFLTEHVSQDELADIEVGDYVEDLIEEGFVKGSVIRTLSGNAYIIERLTLKGKDARRNL